MRPDRAVFSLLSCGLLLPLTASAAAPSTYAAVVGTKTAYGLTVTGNILVGRTRKPMAVYQDVQFKVRGVIHEEILESSVRDGLLIRLGYEHGSMTARSPGFSIWAWVAAPGRTRTSPVPMPGMFLAPPEAWPVDSQPAHDAS